ncbi:hypothetical protein FNQ90_03045 [Streptomyces alkaliphilus]|uniref:Putative T7SS secretion signal domain-containing protein n=1 Tax=Streptomyces alkaliphilus TaxID=1472722 RepID=A0A7W3TAA9_9ACTN|nr:hypothetical protein [Streptomyces alkaliphilus]MBB0243112.1 hypothetical protein [Streptomyces alkaliphilus]
MGSVRPRDWEPLTDDGRDPVPGDWEAIKEAAARYRRTATMIGECGDLLDELGEDGESWKGKAGEAVREEATDLAANIRRVWGRYNAAANALAEYWPELEEAQEESLELRRTARSAQGTIGYYAPKAEAAEDEDAEDHDRLDHYEERLEEAREELAAARARLGEVVSDVNRAAEKAAEAIGDFIGGDQVKDHWTDGFKNALTSLKNALIVLGEIAGWVAAIAGIAALLVGWIPVIGQALAAVLGVIALVATLFSLLGNILKGNWAGVALDVVGLLTFGIGRAVGSGLKAAGASSKWTAFRSLRAQLQFGNRTARVTRAESIMGAPMNRLRHAAGNTASPPSGVSGWAREAFGGLGTEFRQGVSTIFSRQSYANVFSGADTHGLRARLHQVFANPNAAADASVLAGARAAGADAGSAFTNMSNAQLGAQATGAGGLGVTAATQLDSLSVAASQMGPLSITDNPVIGDVVPTGDFTYTSREAEKSDVCVP